MAAKTTTNTWKDNVGQVFLSDTQDCFWVFPIEFFCNEKLCVTSPWFLHLQERWRFVKVPDEYNYVTLYLWKQFLQNSANYGVRLSLKTVESTPTILSEVSGSTFSDFGSVFRNFCSLDYVKVYPLSRCGLIKLNFVITRAVPTLDSQPSIETNVEDDKAESESKEAQKSDEPEVKGIERLAHNLKQLLLTGENSDVVFVADHREFQVHKAILAARSSVFASMFQHDMAEKKSGIVDIPDCTAESFEVFLQYLYTGSADTMSPNNAFNLYYAADKYQVHDLKEECVDYLMGIMSVETFCDIIALSLRHEESKLRKKATQFFRENIKEIIKTVQWQKYMAENPTHANELLIKALNA